MMVVCGTINDIKITAVASDFDFSGASMAMLLKERLFYTVFSMQLKIKLLFYVLVLAEE